MTYCEEPRPGKNRALLTALREAEGDLFVFSDDDVIPDPAWLVSLGARLTSVPISSVRRHDSAALGSPARAMGARRRGPRCLLFDHGLGSAGGPIRPALVAGPNMAIRRRVFEQGYRFDPEVGPSGGDYAMGPKPISPCGSAKRDSRSGSVRRRSSSTSSERTKSSRSGFSNGPSASGAASTAAGSAASRAPPVMVRRPAPSLPADRRASVAVFLGRRVQASRKFSRTMGAPSPSGLRHPGPAALQQPDATNASPGTQ